MIDVTDDTGKDRQFPNNIEGRKEESKSALQLWFEMQEGYHTPPDPNDSWDIGESWESYTFTALNLKKTDSEWNSVLIPIQFEVSPGETVFIVVLSYTDGCTFGYTTGQKQICGVFKDRKDAQKMRDFLNREEDTAYAYYGHGYFERRESVDILAMTVGE